jgi:hypothetical protein
MSIRVSGLISQENFGAVSEEKPPANVHERLSGELFGLTFGL